MTHEEITQAVHGHLLNNKIEYNTVRLERVLWEVAKIVTLNNIPLDNIKSSMLILFRQNSSPIEVKTSL